MGMLQSSTPMDARTRHVRLVEIACVPSAEDDVADLLPDDALDDFELEVAEHPERWPVIPGKLLA